ncbi:membrane protein insertase YidC [Schleiferilactobacillus shenzhenensis]|uniref:OxaA2 n=1 Tax=Schleiferilactobacillus shenzhenensis LY-73 TaxID=1231336 RepID=U4TMS7_9LACO|nr:membrane protein insertase YidC [Schleiferilactobacillus shenzhenensis]ERL65519.1 OxaA2 [Schleiferilactobacillus shenzhenensis LY-73]
MLKKKYVRYALLLSSLAVLLIVLGGCAQPANLKPPTSGPMGWTYQYLAGPLREFMKWCARMISGPNAYGWGILILTVIIRLILMPLMLRQQSKSTYQQEKMAAIQPQMAILQKLQKRTDLTMEQKQELSVKQMELFKKNNVSMLGGIGCLPMLIQLPILWALYQSIEFTPQIAQATFFGINLGARNYLIAIIATAVAALQSWMMVIGVPEAQKKTMQSTMFLGPLMTIMFTLFLPAGLGLYMLATNVVMLVQQVIATYVIQPRMKARAARELKENPVVTVVTEDMFGAPAASAAGASSDPHVAAIHERNRERNAGKQQRPHAD